MRYMPSATHTLSILKIENIVFLAYLRLSYFIIAHGTQHLQSKNCLGIDKQHVNNSDDDCVSTKKCICSIAFQFQIK